MVFDMRVDAKRCLCLWLPGALQPNQGCAGSSAAQVCWFWCSLEVLFSGARTEVPVYPPQPQICGQIGF